MHLHSLSVAVRALVYVVMLGSALDLAAVTVRFEPVAAAGNMEGLDAELLLLSRFEDQVGQARRISFDVPGSVELELPAEVRYLRLKSSSLWSPTVTVSNQGTTTMEIRATGEIHGALTLVDPEADQIPIELGARLAPAVSSPRGRAGPEAEFVSCRIAEGEWSCRLPSGTWNVRLRSPRHVSQFYWDVSVMPGERQKLANLVLKRGTSLVGWTVSDGDIAVEGALLRLIAQELVSNNSAQERNRKEVAGHSVRADARGFFHFEGIPPGAYYLIATQASSVSSRIPVQLIEGMEAELREAVRLQEPRAIQIRISPFSASDRMPWRLSLSSVLQGRAQRVGTASTDPSGAATINSVADGEYHLYVDSADGSRWLAERIEVGIGSKDFSYAIRSTRVHGTVVLGERPLAATLTFGEEHEPVFGKLRSGAEGTFEGDLPTESLESASVLVRAGFPPVDAQVENVGLSYEEDGSVSIDIEILSTRIVGEVIYADGQHAERAIVTLDSGRRIIQTSVDESGTFHLEGLEPGTVKVSATAPDGESVPVEVELFEDRQQEEPLTLTLEHFRRIRGRVVAGSHPVSGAALWPLSMTERSLLSTPFATAIDGTFSIEAPPGEPEIVVALFAPGFSFRTARLSSSREERLAVTQQGASLILELPATSDDRRFYLLDRYGYVPVGLLIRRWPTSSESVSEGRMRHIVSAVEPGPYSLCAGTGVDIPMWLAGQRNASCTSVFVPHLGTATLRAD